MAGSIKLAAPSGGSVTLNAVDTANNFVMSVPAAAGVLINADSATGAAQLPVGTTAQRPASPVTGQLRYNTTTSATEVYNGTSWGAVGGYLINYVVVAGGGGGGYNIGGGGGAGGFLASVFNPTIGTVYSITVGAGGAANTQGSNSIFGSLTALGGGLGGGNAAGGNGGSGGGGGGGSATVAGGTGTSLQGTTGATSSYVTYGGGGGGGGIAPTGQTGGIPASSFITGTATGYAGGGAGGGASGGAVAYGGGGNGGGSGAAGSAGTANTGGGGGGGGGGGASGAAGGSGVVILSIPTANYSGTYTGSPTVTTSGSNTILKFTASGSYTA